MTRVAFFSTTLLLVYTDWLSTQFYTLSLHDALPISVKGEITLLIGKGEHVADDTPIPEAVASLVALGVSRMDAIDRKSTRLNSSHTVISYAVFCLKKKMERSCMRGAFPANHAGAPRG